MKTRTHILPAAVALISTASVLVAEEGYSPLSLDHFVSSPLNHSTEQGFGLVLDHQGNDGSLSMSKVRFTFDSAGYLLALDGSRILPLVQKRAYKRVSQ